MIKDLQTRMSTQNGLVSQMRLIENRMLSDRIEITRIIATSGLNKEDFASLPEFQTSAGQEILTGVFGEPTWPQLFSKHLR